MPTATPTATLTPTFTTTFTLTPTPPPTATPTALPALQRLRLTSMCSATPALTRRWRVRSTNSYPVAFTWDVVGTAQTGAGVAPPASDVFFETATVTGTPNTVRLAVGGAPQDVKASGGAMC